MSYVHLLKVCWSMQPFQTASLRGFYAEDGPLLRLPSRWQYGHMGKVQLDMKASQQEHDHTGLS